jgi:hypothetical protein
MFVTKLTSMVLAAVVLAALAQCGPCLAFQPPPQAPADLSWLPHGYGGDMDVDQTTGSWQKGLHGFRVSPGHIGCWSHPLWGWDVNGFYLGPQVVSPDPAWFQLPIGLIYPGNTPPMPQPDNRVRKVSAPPQSAMGF